MRPGGRDAPRDDTAADDDGLTADGEDADGGAAESELDPVDPADPVVSAAATAIGDTAAPTPRATANAPTRPT